MKVEYFVLHELKNEHARVSEEETAEAILRMTPARREHHRTNHYAITALCMGDPGRLFVGVTNMAGDILHEFDTKTNAFRSLNFAAQAEPFDAKIHRGLWYDRGRKSLFFGIATLTPMKDVMLANGGRIMRYDLGSGQYESLGRPCPGAWIQAIAYDGERELIYSFGLPSLDFAVSEVAGKKVRRRVDVASIVHMPAIDPAGGLWATYSMFDHAFFRYDPDKDEFQFPGLCMPNAKAGANKQYPGSGPVDSMFTGPDGMVYVGGALGDLYRIDPQAMKLDYLGHPLPVERLPGLCFGPDGRLYGVGGDRNQTRLFAMDPRNGAVEVLTAITAADGQRCYRVHDLVYQDGRFFIAETDNPYRNGYLWSVTL